MRCKKIGFSSSGKFLGFRIEDGKCDINEFLASNPGLTYYWEPTSEPCPWLADSNGKMRVNKIFPISKSDELAYKLRMQNMDSHSGRLKVKWEQVVMFEDAFMEDLEKAIK